MYILLIDILLKEKDLINVGNFILLVAVIKQKSSVLLYFIIFFHAI